MQIAHCEAIAQAAWNKLIERVAQKGEVITVQNMHANVIKRAKTEVEKVRRVLKQAEATELKKKIAKIAAPKKLKKQLYKKLKAYLKA